MFEYINKFFKAFYAFEQTQYVQVSLLKPAPFCMLFAGLGSTNKPATSLLFSYLILVLSSPPSFLLSQTLWQEPSSLSCSIRLQWVPGHSFLTGNDADNELATRAALLAPSAIPCSLSYPLLSFLGLEAYCLIEILLTHRFPRFSPRTLCSVFMLAVFSLVFAAPNKAFF